MRARDLRLEDGRTLRVHVREPGPAVGLTVLWHHGTPNIGVPPAPWSEVSARLGIRWVGPDRPGYGGSTPQPGRTVGDVAADAAAVADTLEIDRFAVVGHSGGGPHALACAALLPDRVVAAVCVSGLAPRDAPGLDWYAGMAAPDVASLRAAEGGRRARLAHEARGVEEDEEEPVPADARALAGAWSWLAGVTGPEAGAGLEGLVEDDLAFVAPWGFEPAEINVPLVLLHGSADPVVPPAHSAWLAARCGRAVLRLTPEDGHVSVLDAVPAALAWLREVG